MQRRSPGGEDFPPLHFSQYLSKIQNDKSSPKSNLVNLGSPNRSAKNVLLESPTNTSPEINYVPSGICSHVSFITPEELQTSPEILAQKLFQHSSKSQFALRGPLPLKTRHTYANFLGMFQYADVKDKPNRDHPKVGNKFWSPTKNDNEISFSQIYINQIPSASQWGIHSDQTWEFNSAYDQQKYQFTLADAKDAFYHVFWYQNSKNTHTWWIRLNSTILNTDIPPWFCHWFHQFGPNKKIFPKILNDLFEKFQTKFCKSPPHTNFPPPLLTFVAKFEIPWCFFFKFGNGFSPDSTPQIWRTHMIKWWDKFDQGRFEQIKNFIDGKSIETQTDKITPGVSSNVDDHILKLQNLIKSNPKLSPDQAKMQILNEISAQMDMAISPESSAMDKKEGKKKVNTPEIEEISDSENQNHDPDKEFLDQCSDCGIGLEDIAEMSTKDLISIFKAREIQKKIKAKKKLTL